MHRIIARCPAKLNLTLEVMDELPDGYHEVLTLMQAIDLEDEITFEMSESADVQIDLALAANCAVTDIPVDDSNLICKAVKAFLAALPEKTGLTCKITIDKSIPVAAGLAGGSSNAAATLVALNYFFGHPFSPEELLVLGGRLGADVPFCIEGGTCIGRGRGDELTRLSSGGRLCFALVKPHALSISTAWVYSALDDFRLGQAQDLPPAPDLFGAVNALTSGNPEMATTCFGNDFESVVFAHHPELASLKQSLLDLGCWCCHMTGSGPTLYAVVANREMAHLLRRRLVETVPDSVVVAGGGRSEPAPSTKASPASVPAAGRQVGAQIDFWIAETVSYGARLIGERDP